MDEVPLFSTSHQSDSEPVYGDSRELLSTASDQEMSFRETIMSVCSFIGWAHVPVFDLSYSKDWERAKGKNSRPSGKVSASLPPND